MMFIEFLTEVLRPVTLTIRLTVNITVGHLINIGVYEFLFSFTNNVPFVLYFFLYVVTISVEFLVFLIQSFVFSRLLSVYLLE